MYLENDSLALLHNLLPSFSNQWQHLPSATPYSGDSLAMKTVLEEVAKRMADNYPYFHPLYVGQMLKPPHPIARAAYMLATWVNPNNHALDGGRASSAMERDAVDALAQLFGWSVHLGHLTSGGTMANLEAIWIAGKLHPNKAVAASAQAHYTHERISEVLGIPFIKIAANKKGQLDIDDLENKLKQKPNNIGTVIATMGTTGTGAVDSLSDILDLQARYGFRIHADAAYGGYFNLITSDLLPATASNFNALRYVDSLVIDPHKHGLQPYGCGCVLFQDSSVGRFYKHDSPYTYFSSADLHLGEISLECSRAGASAVALWATQRLLPMTQDGEFAAILRNCRQAAALFYDWLSNNARFIPLLAPELDIVAYAPLGDSLSQISALSRAIFEQAAHLDLHLAVFNYPTEKLPAHWSNIAHDQANVTCLRSCFMKPEHKEWLPEICKLLQEAHSLAIR